MCGIVGYLAAPESPLPAEARRTAALAALAHRGPDAEGHRGVDGVWFGHRRLSILDLSCAGNQPMTTADGRLTITYNGEVYNFRELAAALGLADLRSATDTEVVLRSFERLGTAGFARLNGMFAFAIHDRVRRRVHLVRDPLGIKPLYYAHSPQGLAFASEIKAIAALGVPLQCDVATLHEWLYYGNALGERTFYTGIAQVPAGTCLEVDLDAWTVTPRTYWSLPPAAAADAEALPDVIARTRGLLEAAVTRQLVSDVPVGVFLSGGIDSSAITAFASRHYGGRLATYAAGFDDPRFVDERPKARRVAAHFATDHHEMFIGGADVPALVERLVRHHDGPFSDAANIPLFLMAEQLRGRIKVVLQGDGGDEVFGGYRRYVTLRHYRWLHAAARVLAPLQRPPLAARTPFRVRRYMRAYGAADLGSTMAQLLTLEEREARPAALFHDPLRSRIEAADPFARYRECQARYTDRDPPDQMALVDLSVELPDIFLEKVDRSTMAASVEVRVPFLDVDLVSYVAALPSSIRIRRGQKKWLLKQALAGIVPADILEAPKSGFNVPFGHWLRGALKPFFFDHLSTFVRRHPGMLDETHVRACFSGVQQGRLEYEYLMWKLLQFLVWTNASGVEIRA